ncbi:hypothetical protein [Dyadobacter jiangsuensis]|uniref:Uncharacterized protein n=1 Tax=Dyadobacter jiangsuensis TaxID=1591085 RepID=A0A2P8FXX1_9BACT|nr:hypothetical protein [Dyadobacter jiangsuensis]PSL26548.1 hypothetical protein CLV60_10939 [Dyadobacter jiangsuensis]
MERKDKHISKFLHGALPDPEIPADDAWAGMSDMLDAPQDQGAGVAKWHARLWKSIGKFKGLFILISTVVTVSAVIALVVFNGHKTEYRPTAPSSIPSEHRNSANKVSTSDSVTEKRKTAIRRQNTANIPATANSATDRVKTGGNEGTVKSGTRGQKVSEHVAPTRVGAQPKIPDNAGPTRTSSHTRKSDTYAPVISGRNAHVRNHSREDQPDNAFPNIPAQSESARNKPKSTGLLVTNQTNITPVSHEKTTSASSSEHLLNSLEPLPGHFEGPKSDLSKLVQKPLLNVAQPTPKKQNSLLTNLHFGPEWNINRAFASPDYMLTGTDGHKHPLRLAIPGVFVSKSWKRHTATFIFNPLHSYFGEKERVAQRLDTIPSADSTLQQISRNTNFIKAFGLDFSLQYQYQLTRGLSLVGGLSYARYSSALLRKETEYPNGMVVDEGYLTARSREALKSYVRPEQWNIRVGILFYSRTVFNSRLQVGINTIIPLSNLSHNGFKSVKSPNSQMSIRFLIR